MRTLSTIWLSGADWLADLFADAAEAEARDFACYACNHSVSATEAPNACPRCGDDMYEDYRAPLSEAESILFDQRQHDELVRQEIAQINSRESLHYACCDCDHVVTTSGLPPRKCSHCGDRMDHVDLPEGWNIEQSPFHGETFE